MDEHPDADVQVVGLVLGNDALGDAVRPEFDRVIERMRENQRLPEVRDFPAWREERRGGEVANEIAVRPIATRAVAPGETVQGTLSASSDHELEDGRLVQHFTITGRALPEAAVQRAVELSRDKYCSVWHSLRQDIALKVTFDVTP